MRTKTPPTPRARHERHGFSLVELLVALGVLSVGLVGLASGNLVATRGGAHALALVRAADVAAERLSLLEAAPVGELAEGSATDARCESPVTENGIVVLEVECRLSRVGLGRIELGVDVKHPLAGQPVTLEAARHVSTD